MTEDQNHVPVENSFENAHNGHTDESVYNSRHEEYEEWYPEIHEGWENSIYSTPMMVGFNGDYIPVLVITDNPENPSRAISSNNVVSLQNKR